MKEIIVKREDFENLEFKIEVKPTGYKRCCCGFVDCEDPDCSLTPLIDKL